MDKTRYWNVDEVVDRGRQGAKWWVKYRRALARRDQVD